LTLVQAAGCSTTLIESCLVIANGAAAASGKVDEALRAQLLMEDFFRRKPPGASTSGSEFADRQIAENAPLAPRDLLAAFTELTAASDRQRSSNYYRSCPRFPLWSRAAAACATSIS
jgi:hypothetical protein